MPHQPHTLSYEIDSNEDHVLGRYLAQVDCLYKDKEWPKLDCPVCRASKRLYCSDCCQLLVPSKDLPESIRNQTLNLPFHVDFLLADRRASSTGIQVASIFHHLDQETSQKVRVFDLKTHSIPDYRKEDEENGFVSYVLFPGTDSIPLSSVQRSTSAHDRPLRLIVLDCKWRRFRPVLDSVSYLPLVHLDHPPAQSYFWRWHSAGSGCVSSAEAVFWAAHQMDPKDDHQLLDILWLFAVQRSLIQQRFESEKEERTIPFVPFSLQAKDEARKLRTQKPHKEGRPTENG